MGILSAVPCRALRFLVVLMAGLALGACRLDVAVDVEFGADGTGQMVVSATADAEVVAQAPGLADDLRFDDAAAAGWSVEGPAAAEGGGLTVTLRHPVASAEEATTLLASLGPPFVGVRLQRTTEPDDGREVTVTLTGRLQLAGGWEAFADSELVAAAGGVPFGEDLAARGATPAGSMAVRLRAALPGDVADTTGSVEDGALHWEAPLDGSSLELATTTIQRPAAGGSWARPLSWVALALLIVWVALAVGVIVLVARARRRRVRH